MAVPAVHQPRLPAGTPHHSPAAEPQLHAHDAEPLPELPGAEATADVAQQQPALSDLRPLPGSEHAYDRVHRPGRGVGGRWEGGQGWLCSIGAFSAARGDMPCHLAGSSIAPLTPVSLRACAAPLQGTWCLAARTQERLAAT
mgnify:CR=1 FL=1